MMAARKRDFERVRVEPAPPHEGRRVMPIEQALVWAYADELASADHFGAACSFLAPQPTWNLAPIRGSNGHDAPFINRIVAPDALAIHKRVCELEHGNWLAVDIELTGLLCSTYQSLSEAAYFEEALPKAANLVIVHARLGTVPDLSGHPSPFPVRQHNGSVPIKRLVTRNTKTVDDRDVGYEHREEVRIARKSGRGGFYPQGSFCEVGYYPDWDQVLDERAEYMVWWLALRWLADNLDHLERLYITLPELPMQPWLLDIPTMA